MELFLEKFTSTIHGAYGYLSKLIDQDVSSKKHPDKWSQKEILGHLIDSANINHNRFIYSLSKDDLIFTSYPQDEWVILQKYNQRDWGDLIELWKLLNINIVELVNNIPIEKRTSLIGIHNFDKICWENVAKEKDSSLDYLIKDYIGHLKHHLEQIYTY